MGEYLKNSALRTARDALRVVEAQYPYEAECAFFAKKYGMSFEEFVKHLEAYGKEDFGKEDDLLTLSRATFEL
ncbi:MAG: hypothetical protein AB1426_04175 [Bacillota bacterium]